MSGPPPYPAGGPPPGYSDGYGGQGGYGGGQGGYGGQGGGGYGQQGQCGQGGKDMLKGVGDFLGRNKMAVGTALFNAKMGGGLGKMFAAGQAADLANRYQKESSAGHHSGHSSGHSSGYPGGAGGYGSSSGGGHGGSSTHKYGEMAKGAAGGALGLGKSLLGKAEKLLDGAHGHKDRQPQPQGPAYAPPAYGQPQPQPYDQPYPPAAQPYPAASSGGYGAGPMRHGTVVTLMSLGSGGRAVQIVMSSSGALVVDAQGAVGAPNAQWTVLGNADLSVSLHNRANFLCLSGGEAAVEAGSEAGPRPAHLSWFPQHSAIGDPNQVALHSVHGTVPLAFGPNGSPTAYAPHGDPTTLFSLRLG